MSKYKGRNGRGRSGGAVPRDVAERIADQRDRLAEEVQKLRRQNEELAEAIERAEAVKEELEDERDELEKKLGDAKARVREFREELEQERSPGEPQEAQQKIAKLKEQLASLKRELDRVRERAETTEQEARRNERIRLLSGFGDTLESIERGLSMQPEGPGRQGLEAIYSQLLEFLSREGATLTGEVGEEMDPRLHEAVEVVEDADAPSGTIVDVARRGVVLEDGSVALPAKVQVAR